MFSPCKSGGVFEYDDSGRTTKVTSKNADGAEIATVSYAYDAFDNMTEIARGNGMKYALAYNAFHNLESIGVDGKAEKLIHYTYKNGNGRLKQMTYANGDTMKATYNSIGQMVAETWTDACGVETARYKYVYDGEGNIVRSIDIFAKKEYNYEYEEGKIVRATESDIEIVNNIVTLKVLVNTVRYYYSEDNLSKKVIIPVDGTVQTIFYENNDDNTVVKFSVGNKTVTSHSKTDSFGRKIFDEFQLGSGFISRQFTYHAGQETREHKEQAAIKSSPTTQLVKEILFSDNRTLSYEYDAEERITSVTESYKTADNKTITNKTEYTYDALGQLLTETVNGSVVNSMKYDNYGNIVEKNGKKYLYDATWHDLLKSYDGYEIEYDAQGNPTKYLGHDLTWEKGRQLKSFDSNTYTYNANGIRTSKTIKGVKHNYVLDGSKILREAWDGNILIPMYDEEDAVCGIIYNNVPHYFQKNLQGDIIAIANANGEVEARYTYDAWGAITNISGTDEGISIAVVNPFRYRGYYYDQEIALYYLLSRYYDPTVGRFINSDICESLFAFLQNFSNNLYTYCNNNVISNKDTYGHASKTTLKRESWIARAVFKFIPNITSSIREKEIWSTPKWLGAYLELTLGMSVQSNANGIIGLGFSKRSFDVGISVCTGKTSTAVAVGASWTESYIVSSLVYSSRYERIFYAINFKLAVKHWLVVAAAILCAVVPQLTPIAGYAARLLCSSARTAKPILKQALPILLGV